MNPESAGGDLYLGNLAEELAMRGHRVTMLIASRCGENTSKGGNAVKVYPVRPGLFYPLRVFVRFLRLRNSTDIVVEEVIGGKKFPSFAVLYARNRLIGIWYQLHARIFEEQFSKPLSNVFSAGERVLASMYRKTPIVTLSRKSMHELIGIGLDPKKIGIVPSAAFMHLPLHQDIPPFDEREDNMIFIGKIRRYKHVDHAILALRGVVDSTPGARLIIAGNIGRRDQKHLEELQDLSERLGLGDHINFKIYPGMIPQREKISLLTQSKVLVQPSPVEGFGMTSVEANGCGTPVVVSNGIPEDVVIDGYNGLVYPFGNFDLMIHSINKLLDDGETWTRLSSSGLKFAQRFNWGSTAEAFEEFVRDSARDADKANSFFKEAP